MIRAHSRLALLALAAVTLAVPAGADAQRPKKKKVTPACGIAFLPMAEGSQWLYESFVPPDTVFTPGLRVDEPPSLTVKVVSVAKKGDSTTIELEESYRKVVLKTTLECTKEKLLVTPESFFYAGQPGGGILLKLDKFERKGETFLVKEGLKEDGYEELKVLAIREPSPGSKATLLPARLEVERKMTIKGKESTESAMGDHNATRIEIQLTGRAAMESQKDKPFNMPQLDVVMWFEPNVGLVRVENRLGQGWRLKGHAVSGESLPEPTPVPAPGAAPAAPAPGAAPAAPAPGAAPAAPAPRAP